jgi:predicted CoA-binding protein
MTAIKDAAAGFLASKRVAVTGVSRRPKDHASNTVYKRLRERGYEVFAVNPNADEVEGDRCYRDLRSISGGVDAVVIGTRPELAEGTMRECAELGVKHVWMHLGPGAGSVSEEGGRLRPRARHRGDRRRLPVHVRPDRRLRTQGDARRLHADGQRPEGGLTGVRERGERVQAPCCSGGAGDQLGEREGNGDSKGCEGGEHGHGALSVADDRR